MMFYLNEQLEQDTIDMGQFNLCQLLLMNDKRYPWFILVPKRNQVIEVFDLNEADQALLWLEINTLASKLASAFKADKMNIANLGNVVSQLHIHVIVRYKVDETWPTPVWGKGSAIPYSAEELTEIKKKMTTLFPDNFLI